MNHFSADHLLRKKNHTKLITEYIAPIVRMVGEEIEKKIVPVKEAIKIADDLGLDLVEISPNANSACM